jgi:hypothetical protein
VNDNVSEISNGAIQIDSIVNKVIAEAEETGKQSNTLRNTSNNLKARSSRLQVSIAKYIENYG